MLLFPCVPYPGIFGAKIKNRTFIFVIFFLFCHFFLPPIWNSVMHLVQRKKNLGGCGWGYFYLRLYVIIIDEPHNFSYFQRHE
jgi:hypothetical protein